MAIPTEQKEFVIGFKEKAKFTTEFAKKFASEPNVFGRAQTVWQFRKKYAEELKVEKEKEREKQHVILAPTKITTKATTNERSTSLPDVGELIVNQTHILSELLATEKEMLTTLKEANDIKREHVLFLRSLTKKNLGADGNVIYNKG